MTLTCLLLNLLSYLKYSKHCLWPLDVIIYPFSVALVNPHFCYQHSQFITGRHEIAPGTLANVGSDLENGCMGFLRLVGVVYMKKHGAA